MDKTESWASPRRGKNLKDAELRDRMISAAVNELQKTGLTVSLEHLEMEELIRLAEVPRSSFYKTWKTKERFFVDLMVALVEPTEMQGAAFDPETVALSRMVVSNNTHRLTTAEGRHAVLREAIRVAAKQNFDALVSSASWHTYTALTVALPSLLEEDRVFIQKALAKAEKHFIHRMAYLYDELLPVVGRKPSGNFTTEQIAAAGAAVVEGLARRILVNPDIINAAIRLPGLDGELVDWHLAAVGFLGIVEIMTEPTTDAYK